MKDNDRVISANMKLTELQTYFFEGGSVEMRKQTKEKK